MLFNCALSTLDTACPSSILCVNLSAVEAIPGLAFQVPFNPTPFSPLEISLPPPRVNAPDDAGNEVLLLLEKALPAPTVTAPPDADNDALLNVLEAGRAGSDASIGAVAALPQGNLGLSTSSSRKLSWNSEILAPKSPLNIEKAP